MVDIRKTLAPPYWAMDPNKGLVSRDFCREIVEPGSNEHFPAGCMGLRVDDDFFAVAALPLDYLDWPLPEIVTNLWPEIEDATFHPDSGSREQEVAFLKARVAQLEREVDALNSKPQAGSKAKSVQRSELKPL